MGRNSVTVDSRIFIHPDKLANLAEALSCDPDDELGASVTNALLYCYLVPDGRDRLGRLQFIVSDADYDQDYDVSPLVALAPHIEDGSFYEEHADDALIVYEVQSGIMMESVYRPSWDDSIDRIGRGKLLSQRELEPESHWPATNQSSSLIPINTASDSSDPWNSIGQWWRMDDLDWVAERKREWSRVEANLKQCGVVGPFLRAAKHYFLTGEDIEQSSEFPLNYRFVFAPYESAKQARELFALYDENSRERMMLLSHHLRDICLYYARSPKVRKKVRDFQKGVLGETYQPIPVIFPGQKKAEPRPIEETIGSWCNDALRWVNRKDQEFRVAYAYFLDQIPYLISMLHHLDHSNPVPERLIALKEYLDQAADLPMTKLRKEFSDNMRQALSGDDVPEFILRHLSLQQSREKSRPKLKKPSLPK